MADVKITDLTELSAAEQGLLFECVKDPSGTPLSRSVTYETLLKLGKVLASDGSTAIDASTAGAIDFNNANFTNVGLINGVKVYRALLSQSGTNAPSATELENSVGAAVWSRNVAGNYSLTLTAAFPPSKTFVIVPTATFTTGPNPVAGKADASGDFVTLTSWDSGAGDLGDDILSNTSIEIRVYP